jgi:predicted  nucleic acid-binding Zn-ribbon protein
MAHHVETIVLLQRALDELKRAQELLDGIPDWMRELHDEHTTRKQEIEALEGLAEEATRERTAAEASINDAQEKLKRYQEQMNSVSTQREYGALLAEIDTVKGQIAEFEKQALEAIERHEQAQKDLEELHQSFGELDDRYSSESGRWEREKPAVGRQVRELEGRVEELKESLPPEILRRFDRIFERRSGQALAPIRRLEKGGKGPAVAHCGVCNYRVRPQVVVAIRNQGTLIECDSCKRILYLEEDDIP